MAALREGASANEDLSSRCLSLLDEVKDLIEAHKSGQSGENSASDREARPSSLPEASQGRSCLYANFLPLILFFLNLTVYNTGEMENSYR